MAEVHLAPAAVEDLERLIAVLTLPAETRLRVRRSLQALREFPRLGAGLSGGWVGRRFVVGPWRWMLIIYELREDDDIVVVLTIQDSRSSTAVTACRCCTGSTTSHRP